MTLMLLQAMTIILLFCVPQEEKPAVAPDHAPHVKHVYDDIHFARPRLGNHMLVQVTPLISKT